MIMRRGTYWVKSLPLDFKISLMKWLYLVLQKTNTSLKHLRKMSENFNLIYLNREEQVPVERQSKTLYI